MNSLIIYTIDELHKLKGLDYDEALSQWRNHNERCWKEARRQMRNQANRIYKQKMTYSQNKSNKGQLKIGDFCGN